jgi:hypothetical protein
MLNIILKEMNTEMNTEVNTEMNTKVNTEMNTKVNPQNSTIPIFYFDTDLSNNFYFDTDLSNNFMVKHEYLKYMFIISSKLSSNQFRGYITKTLSMYPKFKAKSMINPVEINDYFRRCRLISIIQLMGMLYDHIPQFDHTIGLIKIAPSKNGFKTSCIIDDSTVLDKITNEIRDSDGSLEEPHRGHRMFYSLSFDERESVFNAFFCMAKDLNFILNLLLTNYYFTFDPIKTLQEIIKYCISNNKLNIVNNLSWEIHDEPHLLTQEERNALFDDYDHLYMLWNTNFITNNGGKLRIFILGLYFNYINFYIK